ncbi:MAG TPA: ferredoxin-thioredoxin reductase catalytic domain-containing protein [Candidatus Fermentibacter sp.]|nr:ferredoxin-thioredoxin reductase catalytic domain-containing protein [Candidatus Fermentibacter sp.]
MEPEALLSKLTNEAEASGYSINPDRAFALELAQGLALNTGRYGYPACPCRLASGDAKADRDIVCPCDYRDADLDEFGSCYCALYVSAEIARGEGNAAPVPERRPAGGPSAVRDTIPDSGLPYPVWRCRVCGYLCARDNPPGICPVCKASRDRFEIFIGRPSG